MLGDGGLELGRKWRQKEGILKVFWGRQVGAFCKNRARHTGGPFIFCPKTAFLRFSVGFRG